MAKTKYIVLRKTPYQETSLIVSGLSPEYGRLDFLLKGARSVSRRKFPVMELFREFSIEFKESSGRSGLFSMQNHEPIARHDDIVKNTDNYLAACKYAGFLLKHSQPMLEAPAAYHSFCVMLNRMEETNRTEPWRTFALLVFLDEGGFLPEHHSEEDEGGNEDDNGGLLNRIISCASGEAGAENPEISESYSRKLTEWAESLCLYHSLL